MEYITCDEVTEIHQAVIALSGGSAGLRDYGALTSSVDQPLAGFGDFEAFPSAVEKAAALGFYLTENHPFADGNKRTAHACIEVVLRRNGYRIYAPVDEQEAVMLQLASGQMPREDFVNWVVAHAVPHP